MNIKHLEDKIKSSYESGVTQSEAEKLAGEFLHAQIQIAEELYKLDLDSRMRKSGVKAIKAAVYMSAATKTDKKPSDTLLEQLVNQDELVQKELKGFDESEAEKDHLQNIYNILKEAHIFYRTVSRGSFG